MQLFKLIVLDLAGEQQPGAEQHRHSHVCVVMGTFLCSKGVWDRRQVHGGDVEGRDGALYADQFGSQV